MKAVQRKKYLSRSNSQSNFVFHDSIDLDLVEWHVCQKVKAAASYFSSKKYYSFNCVHLNDDIKNVSASHLKHDPCVINADQWNNFRSGRHDLRDNQHEYRHG